MVSLQPQLNISSILKMITCESDVATRYEHSSLLTHFLLL